MAIPPQYSFRPLTSDSDPGFDQFWEIYVESMPPRERKPRNQISLIPGRADYRVLLLMEDTTVIGFSILYSPAHETFCLLEYMAVHVDYRNLGLGRGLFSQTFHDVLGSGSVWGLLEVDAEREPSPDQAIRQARQRFYRKLGCRRVEGLSYLLPLPGEGAPPLMDLLVYRPDRLPHISRPQLERWLTVIYTNVYACAPDDPRIASMMHGIDDPVKLV